MLKVIELFAGYGSQSLALRNLGIEHKVVGISEIDKYATQAYNLLHNEDTINFGDITKINEKELPDCDLITYSYPCQSISISGKQEGLVEGSGTTSSLLWECRRIIKHKKPKYLLMENVKNLVSKKFKPEFDKWCKELEDMGYNNYWQVLNAKDYGISQNRERVFCVSILKEFDKGYTFPEKQELKLRLKDMLEDSVDEKYYINNEKTQELLSRVVNKEEGHTKPKILKIANESKNHYGGGLYDKEGISPTLTSSTGGGGTNNIPKIMQVGMLDIKGNEQIRRVYDENGLSPTLNTMEGGNRQPKILTIDKSIKKSVAKNFERELDEISKTTKDIYQAKCESGWQDNKIGINVSQTLRANNNFHPCLDNYYRIRKLTPRECFRLMGLKDDDINKLKGISNTQQYKLAGNSIVIPVLEGIFKNLLTNQ